MNDLTRRNAVKLLAGSSVLAGGSVLSAAKPADCQAEAVAPPEIPPEARLAETSPVLPTLSPTMLARVLRCRSWDSCVYLAAKGTAGYAQLTPAAFAIAAACQAAGRPVAMRHGGHEANWGNGAGMFRGVVLAVEPADFDEAGEAWL